MQLGAGHDKSEQIERNLGAGITMRVQWPGEGPGVAPLRVLKRGKGMERPLRKSGPQMVLGAVRYRSLPGEGWRVAGSAGTKP